MMMEWTLYTALFTSQNAVNRDSAPSPTTDYSGEYNSKAKPSFSALITRPSTIKRATKISLIVGSILLAINQGELILVGETPAIWKIILTYITPYSVSSYSTAKLLIEHDN